MKKSDIKIGGHYQARISGKMTTVRVDHIRDVLATGGADKSGLMYDVTDLATGRPATFHSAAKFRGEISLTGRLVKNEPESEIRKREEAQNLFPHQKQTIVEALKKESSVSPESDQSEHATIPQLDWEQQENNQ